MKLMGVSKCEQCCENLREKLRPGRRPAGPVRFDQSKLKPGPAWPVSFRPVFTKFDYLVFFLVYNLNVLICFYDTAHNEQRTYTAILLIQSLIVLFGWVIVLNYSDIWLVSRFEPSQDHFNSMNFTLFFLFRITFKSLLIAYKRQ